MKSSIGRKILMALSGFFLMFFLAQHFTINFLSVLSEESFNSVSHFMGTNPLIQYALQPVLLFAVIFHLSMGIYLEIKNKAARGAVKYAMNKPGTNAPWVSRNMVYTGIAILLFLGLHFYDFWIPELVTKYVEGDMTGMHAGSFRYYEELVAKFQDPVRVGIYCLAFIFLALHLLHGFQSSFQSVGFNSNRYTPGLKKFGNFFAIVIPLGFIFIALFHYVSHLN
ncbi:succinate dehydrogenase [Putridiphycobacter roseus]|uniref:Succinate dehydrogenase n=1 Tax=Putridiphycobacter roseus TaxID=2219161 RepID=A0A2W1N4X1_9FLAO|nr:succinate dehydrogenase cytochrome b subunit [Putridiphycobacter roseus]PZE18630.1 succinate dehydrogenase [Putridiphycobacter roseus]